MSSRPVHPAIGDDLPHSPIHTEMGVCVCVLVCGGGGRGLRVGGRGVRACMYQYAFVRGGMCGLGGGEG